MRNSREAKRAKGSNRNCSSYKREPLRRMKYRHYGLCLCDGTRRMGARGNRREKKEEDESSQHLRQQPGSAPGLGTHREKYTIKSAHRRRVETNPGGKGGPSRELKRTQPPVRPTLWGEKRCNGARDSDRVLRPNMYKRDRESHQTNNGLGNVHNQPYIHYALAGGTGLLDN